MSRQQIDRTAADLRSPFIDDEVALPTDALVRAAGGGTLDRMSSFADEDPGTTADADDEAFREDLTIEPDYALEDGETPDEWRETDNGDEPLAFEDVAYALEADDEHSFDEPEDELPDLQIEEDEQSVLPGVLAARVVAAAMVEIARWKDGGLKESNPSMQPVLRQYWRNLGLSRDAADAKIHGRKAWSAAFVSYVMRQAAVPSFRKAGAHSAYIAAAKRSRVTNDVNSSYWAYRITEVAPQLGDIVCKSRKPSKREPCSTVSYDTVDDGSYWPTHGDIVIDVRPNAITVVGGNVENSAKKKKPIDVDVRGFLPERAADGCRYIAVLKLRDRAAPLVPSEPDRGVDADAGMSSSLAALPRQITDMVRSGGLALKVALAMVAGERDVTKLTSMLFFLRHPERGGARIRPEETQQAKEWLEIRDRIVKPALERLSAFAPAAASPPALDTATAAATTVPVGPFGTLTIESPERLRLQYQFKPEDVLWTARLVEGEAGGEDNPENVAVVWALVNRFAIFRKDLHDKTFADFIRRYSTTLQPYLRNPDAIGRAMETSRQNATSPTLRWVDLGGSFFYKGKEYPKGQYQKHLALQAKPWNQLRKGSRLVAERVLGGQVASPIGIASDFDGTHIFLNRNLKKSGRNPSTIPSDEYRRLWVEFTLQHAKRKNRIWIGEHVPGLRQMKSNVFYLHPRTKHLAADTVRILPVHGH